MQQSHPCTAIQHMIREPKQKINDTMHRYNVVGKVSTACPNSEENFISIRPSGFWTKNVNGEYITLENALLCIEVDAFKDA